MIDSRRRLLAVDVGRDGFLNSLDAFDRQILFAVAEHLIDPAGQDRSHDCRDDDGGGDLGVRGGRKFGVARCDLGEGDRRGHSRAGDSGAGNGRLAVTTAQALERKGDGTDDKQRDKAQQDAGNATSDKDLGDSFATDNTIITVLTALFVMIILLFTFQSAGLPVLLVVTIQGSIWMNFSLPYLLSENVYFLGYLVVSAIQMGATIDYAIVITSRYMDLKTYMPIKEAAIEALNQAFPTIVTSGSMLVAAGFIISYVSSNAAVAAIGLALGRGTLTSILLVLLALPQTLLIGDIIIQKTAFTLKRDLAKPLPSAGRIRMNGHIKGYVNGVLEGDFIGVIDGEMGAVVRPKDTVTMEREDAAENASPRLEAQELSNNTAESEGTEDEQ